jgi:CRISPR system Cascade subunit CasC
MTTFLQLHLLTAYPASNLNRDDTGRPKTVDFGGVQRLRVSSQSLKRAWRTSSVFTSALRHHMGTRTQNLGLQLFDRLLQSNIERSKAATIARYVAFAFARMTSKEGKNPLTSSQLVFISPSEYARAFDVVMKLANDELSIPKEWASFLASGASGDEDEDGDGDGDTEEKTSKKTKVGKKPKKHPLATSLLETADSAADIGMFGRMLADDPTYNRDAAVQVAHAMTTHGGTTEDDYYVAVDDLKDPGDREDAGTSFIGVQEFGSGVFYVYVCIDTDLLTSNLAGDRALARDAVAALVESAATVAPRGKQASFASRSRASYLLVERGAQQPRTLAGAFLRPVTGSEAGGDLLRASRDRLVRLRDNMDAAYAACADARSEMFVTDSEVQGSLADVLQFCAESMP